ncbi:MAG: YidC/Oxa1 family membrane protein insertase [Bacillota bacterium]
MQFLTDLFKTVLDAIAGVTGSYGLAIIAMALLIIVVTYPLNAKQMSFSYKMKLVNPKMEEIKKKYKDPNKQNEEIMNLWKEYKINPAAGCLPILVQFPVFIAMFGVLRLPGVFDASPTFLGLELVLPNAEHSFWSLASQNFAYLVVPILAVATTILQQRQISGGQQDSTTRTMNLFLPLMTGYLTITYPTALGLYWVARNVFTIGQYYFFNQQMARRGMLEEETNANKNARKARKDD